MIVTLALALAAAPAAAMPVLPDAVVATSDSDGAIRVVAAPGLTPASQFETGSIGKWACTVSTLRLADQGAFSLDNTLAELLPSFTGPQADQIRLRHLLANRSGLADGLMPAVREDARAVLSLDVDAAGAANRFAAGTPSANAGEKYSYDLVNWIVVQAILERATGKSIDALLHDTLFSADAAALPDSYVATDGRAFDDAPVPASPPQPLPHWLGCAGGMVTTPVDLLAFAKWVADEGLSDAALAELTTLTTPDEDYALGGQLRVDERLGETIFWLSGSNGPYKSRVAYRPSTGEGIAIMTASGDSDPLYALAIEWVEGVNKEQARAD